MRTLIDFVGSGRWNALFLDCCTIFGATEGWRRSTEISVLLRPLAGILPLPTSFRKVSGKNRINPRRFSPEVMDRNQKIQRQPKRRARAPPNTGPRLGAALVLAGLYQSVNIGEEQ